MKPPSFALASSIVFLVHNIFTVAALSKENIPDPLVCKVNGYTGESTKGRVYLYATENRFSGPHVGSIKISEDRKVSLNLPMPSETLSPQEVEKLWGSPTSSHSSNDIKTYKLWGFSAIDKRQKAIFNIDVKYVNQKFHTYKVRSAGILESDWSKL